jgi:hypothetical protein
MEYAFNDRLSVRAEYSHVDLGAESVSLGSFSDVLVTNYVSEKIDLNFDVIKLGVNYTLFAPEHEVESLK